MAAPPSPRTRVRRHAERADYQRDTVLSILDEGLICHLGVVDGGVPFVLPTMYARLGDVIYIHGAPASRMLKTAAGGTEVCLTVTLLDGLVMARSAINHSMNFRSVMIIGKAVEVLDRDEKTVAFEALIEHVCRGRWADLRQPTVKELRATKVLRLPLREASAKVRSGGPKDYEEDLVLDHWAGEIPLRIRPDPVIADPALRPGIPAPGYASGYRRSGWA